MSDRVREIERQRDEQRDFIRELRDRLHSAEGNDPENRRNLQFSIKAHEELLRNLTRELARISKRQSEEDQ